jgi:hypothetical protein
MTRHADTPSTPAADPYTLRVYRVLAGPPQLLRVLAADLRGLLVHWHRGRSVYCPGEGCPSATHAAPWTWRSYAAAHLWDVGVSLWFPCVLEVTEHAEQDMRGVYRPEQVWEFSRADRAAGKKAPIAARLHQSAPAVPMADRFSVLDVLRRLYHVEAVELRRPNPLPARTQVVPLAGQPPTAAAGAADDAAPSREDWERFRARLGLGQPLKNGHSTHE